MTENRLRRVPCPRCRKSADWYDNPYRPFCSERCKLIDLGDWADEAYRIKGEPAEKRQTSEERDQPESEGS
ncbi:MAG: DNA gyrase inhibitor YacG [bacterium]|nr:DNA gyrase inhibitor YacG [bacterium]